MSVSAGSCDFVEKSIYKKRLRKRSKVWDHFEETPDCQRAICKYYGKSMGAESKSGTIHLNRHLENENGLECQQDGDQHVTMGIRDEVKKFGWTIEKAWEVEVKKAILAEVPFAPSDCKKALSRLMGLMDMDKAICSYYEQEKEKLAKEFKDLTSRVCFSYEIMEELNCISVTAHFINEDFNLVKKLIGFKKLTDINSESCVAHTIRKCISDWKLGDKIFSFTGKDYLKYVSESLRENFFLKMLLRGMYFVPCYKKGMTCFYSDISPLYFNQNVDTIANFIVAVQAVHCQVGTFNQIAKERCLPPINVDWLNQFAVSSWHLDCSYNKHWELAVKMFKEAIPYKDVFRQYAKINCGRLGKGHHIDWEKVEAAVKLSDKLFDKVHESIDKMSRFNYPTLNLDFPVFWEIQDIMLQKEYYGIGDLWLKIWSRIFYQTDNEVSFAACVLDPQYRYHIVRFYFDDSPVCNQIWERFQKLFDAYVDGKKKYLVPRVKRSKKGAKTKTQSTELDEYLTDDLVGLDDASFNLLGWWKQNRLRYPVLSRMARDVLAVPSCVYSIEGNISSDLRVLNGVSPKLVEALICSKDWIISAEQSISESMESAGGGGA